MANIIGIVPRANAAMYFAPANMFAFDAAPAHAT
jgi:hypothetical protein